MKGSIEEIVDFDIQPWGKEDQERKYQRYFQNCWHEKGQHIFKLSLIIEGTIEKVYQFVISFYSKNCVLMNKNVFLSTTERLNQ